MASSRLQANWRRHERGASAVEFALILPVLILLVGAVIDFGFVFSQQITFNNAARDAARAGVVTNLAGNGLSCETIISQARDSAVVGAIGARKVDVAVSVAGANGACTVAAGSTSVVGASTLKPCTGSNAPIALKNLVVTMTYRSVPPFPIVFTSDFQLTARGDFQCEYS